MLLDGEETSDVFQLQLVNSPLSDLGVAGKLGILDHILAIVDLMCLLETSETLIFNFLFNVIIACCLTRWLATPAAVWRKRSSIKSTFYTNHLKFNYK
jgi:hypothetical protein